MSLWVPSIGVRGRLGKSTASDGILNPPAGALVWVSGYGRVLPGEVGTAVVAGHVAESGVAGPFARLQELTLGDRVTIVDSQGRPIDYTVTATRVATKRAVSEDAVVWGKNTSVRRVALITCDDDDGYRADGHRVSNFVAIVEAR